MKRAMKEAKKEISKLKKGNVWYSNFLFSFIKI
jgi:hypothetical protein